MSPTKRHAKDLRLRRDYGITIEWYEKHAKDGCMICGKMPKTQALAVDHDHKQGWPRGVLCMSCNKGLSYFRDSPNLMYNAAAYLENTGWSDPLGLWLPWRGRVGGKARRKRINKALKEHGLPKGAP